MSHHKRKVAVVLSGGGAKGAYEAGALHVIAQKTKQIDVMTGASIGAINAAVFAWEYEKSGDMLRAAKAVKSVWLELEDLFRISFFRILREMAKSFIRTASPVRFASIVDNTQIRTTIARLIPRDVRISDIGRIELAINATSLTEGKTVSFTRDNDATLYEAVLASSCIPLLFPTRIINDQYFVDGGLFNNTPLRDAIAANATDIFVVELKPLEKDVYMQAIKDKGSFRDVYAVGTRLIEMVTDKIMYEDLKNAKRINQVIDVINALEAADGNSKIVENLKESVGYRKGDHVKRHINFYEIAPSRRLEPPGTLGFDNKDAVRQIMALGEKDAERQL